MTKYDVQIFFIKKLKIIIFVFYADKNDAFYKIVFTHLNKK